MSRYIFARNTERTYFEVEADSLIDARMNLSLAEDENDFATGTRPTDTEEADFDLVDVEDEETDA